MPPRKDHLKFRRRLLALYALTVMEREGSVYGYRVSEIVRDRTQGSWTPGPGSVYPALRRLVVQGFAKRSTAGRRRLYRITPRGRAFLRTIRRRARGGAGSGQPEVGLLWAEILGGSDLGDFLLQRLRSWLLSVHAYLARPPIPPGARARFWAQVRREIQRAGRSPAASPRPGQPGASGG